MMPGRRTKGNALTVPRCLAGEVRGIFGARPSPACLDRRGQKKSAGTRLADGMFAGVAEAYRSRTYHRRLSLPPVLKTGRHTGDDTPPHDRHICDTKPGGKQARPARAGVRQGAALRRCPGPRACGGHGGQGARARIVGPGYLSPERGRALSGPGRLRRGCRQGRQASRSPVPSSPRVNTSPFVPTVARFPVPPALPIARREKRLILFLIPDRCRLTPCRRSEYLGSLAQTGAPSAQRFTALQWRPN